MHVLVLRTVGKSVEKGQPCNAQGKAQTGRGDSGCGPEDPRKIGPTHRERGMARPERNGLSPPFPPAGPAPPRGTRDMVAEVGLSVPDKLTAVDFLLHWFIFLFLDDSIGLWPSCKILQSSETSESKSESSGSSKPQRLAKSTQSAVPYSSTKPFQSAAILAETGSAIFEYFEPEPCNQQVSSPVSRSDTESFQSRCAASSQSAENHFQATSLLLQEPANLSQENAEISALRSATSLKSSTAQSGANAVQSAELQRSVFSLTPTEITQCSSNLGFCLLNNGLANHILCKFVGSQNQVFDTGWCRVRVHV
jgi:hypothetical protein